MEPLVTVVIPAYNAAQYLAETLESVLAQTYQNFEIWIIDDGSTDKTADIARSFVERDPRIRLLTQPNRGVTVARNRGIEAARGEFIAFLDADDLWLPNKLEHHIYHLERNPELGLSYARLEYIHANGSSTGKLSNMRLSNIDPVYAYHENPTCTPSNLVARHQLFREIGGFEETMANSLEDMEHCLRAVCSRWKVEGIDRILVRYRVVPSSLSSDLTAMEEAWERFNQQVETYAPALIKDHRKRSTAVHLRYLARRALRSHPNPQTSLRFIHRALASDWSIVLWQPRRTLLTLASAYARSWLGLGTAAF